jgi:hypothetical protein
MIQDVCACSTPSRTTPHEPDRLTERRGPGRPPEATYCQTAGLAAARNCDPIATMPHVMGRDRCPTRITNMAVDQHQRAHEELRLGGRTARRAAYHRSGRPPERGQLRLLLQLDTLLNYFHHVPNSSNSSSPACSTIWAGACPQAPHCPIRPRRRPRPSARGRWSDYRPAVPGPRPQGIPNPGRS